LAISSYQPLKRKLLPIDGGGVSIAEFDAAIPEKLDAQISCPFRKSVVEVCATHSQSLPRRKGGFYPMIDVDESNALKGITILLIHFNAKRLKSLYRIGHKALSTGLIDSRPHRISNNAINTL
jgi:hypothetical protein